MYQQSDNNPLIKTIRFTPSITPPLNYSNLLLGQTLILKCMFFLKIFFRHFSSYTSGVHRVNMRIEKLEIEMPDQNRQAG